MAAEYTLKSDIVIPEVIAGLVETKLGDNITLLPITEQDNNLVGKPGDTLKFPAYTYIGDATTVNENSQILPGKLEAGTVAATVVKYAKGVSVTDEAKLSGYGDPIGEASKQLARSIDQGVDNALFAALNGVNINRKWVNSTLSADNVADALVLFGEDVTGPKILLTDAAGFAQLRQDGDYIRASDMGQRMITDEVVGEIWGCQILITNKVKNNTTVKEKQHFIVKPGALKLINKRGTLVEVQREADYQRDNIFASKHCVAYLYDHSKVVAITEFTALQVLTAAAGIKSNIGTTGQNDTFIEIPAALAAPVGYKWVYKLAGNDTAMGAFGTPLAGTTDWTSSVTEIAAGANTHAGVLLVDSTGAPVKSIVIALTKKGA